MHVRRYSGNLLRLQRNTAYYRNVVLCTVICHHILYLVLCYIISMQKAMILYNKHLLQGMSIQPLLISDTSRMMVISEEHYKPGSRTCHSNQLPTGCN